MAVQTFVLKIPEAAIADLKNRLSLTRFPDAALASHGPTAAAWNIFATSSLIGRMFSIGAPKKRL